jgi:sugar phosphate isomerase/epimerase
LRFGCCCSLDQASAAVESGFDYVELGASAFKGLEADWDDADYAGLPVRATNLFFDGSIRLFGQDRTPYREYAERTIQRAASLGVELMVIGSGETRRAPEGIDGDSSFIDVAEDISYIANGYGITIAPESLNRTETNVGNDLRTLATGLRERHVGYTADSYHILFEWDAEGRKAGLEALFAQQVPFAPSHVHVANLPRTGVDPEDPMLQGFARRLKELGYDGMISLECTRAPGFDLRGALTSLRSLFA